MENPRTETARDHDDRDLLENATEAPSFSGASGGNLGRDVASNAELDSVDAPNGSQRVRKQDAIDHDQSRPRDRPRD
ncbi:hypothetical protein ACNFJ7_04145 [Sphingomonas sp. HT-1]|uniref:hypothetical protein n=1 Tax=unclassified Sphingomonas TaxID=196159 RepID=UPI0002F1B1C9|nr:MULTISPECIES: hypothetical protein [unclassified Sphingomonas]KTF67288.1 hypothetical protein ATB93_18350 [Sphingomonas sp. WG]